MLNKRDNELYWFLPYTIGAYKLLDQVPESPNLDPEHVQGLLGAFIDKYGLDTNPEAS